MVMYWCHLGRGMGTQSIMYRYNAAPYNTCAAIPNHNAATIGLPPVEKVD